MAKRGRRAIPRSVLRASSSPSYASSLPCLHCPFTSASLQRACTDWERATTQALFGIILRILEAICERSWASRRTFRPTSGAMLNYLRAAVGCSLACLAMFFEPFRPSGHASEAIIVLPRYTLASKQMNAHDSREMIL